MINSLKARYNAQKAQKTNDHQEFFNRLNLLIDGESKAGRYSAQIRVDLYVDRTFWGLKWKDQAYPIKRTLDRLGFKTKFEIRNSVNPLAILRKQYWLIVNW